MALGCPLLARLLTVTLSSGGSTCTEKPDDEVVCGQDESSKPPVAPIVLKKKHIRAETLGRSPAGLRLHLSLSPRALHAHHENLDP